MMKILLTLFLTSFSLISVSANQWNYGHLGPDIWSDYYPSCAGKSQSPINILTACTTYRKFQSLEFPSFSEEKHQLVLTNNGHTIVSELHHESLHSPVQISGGGLNGTFHFVNFHLHWGENYKSGSEHQVNGQKYAGEIHFVYTNPVTSQMAVLGIFMQSYINEIPTPSLPQNDRTLQEWQRYFNIAQTLKAENDSIVFDLNLRALLGDRLQDFWRYQGSLTTPPCTEGVIWTMFEQPILFREDQMKIFRHEIYFEDYRGPQPLYHRVVYRNFLNQTISTIPDYNNCFVNALNERKQEITSFIGNCSMSSFLLLLVFCNIVIVAIVVVYCHVRDSIRKNKKEI